MNVIAEILRINEKELENGYVGTSASWHNKYSSSAWCYVGNLDIKLSEGDIICIMSQFGEIEDINLVRDESTGKSRGFAFVKYEDSRSCVLAVDNFAGSKILGRSIRVDHVETYRLPKHLLEKEEEGKEQQEAKSSSTNADTDPGHAYKGKEMSNEYNIQQGQDLFAPLPPETSPKSNDNNKDNDDDEKQMTKEQRRAAKRKRKEAREAKRFEKEKRKQQKEEAKRERRAKKYRENENYDDVDSKGDNDDKARRRRHRHRDKKHNNQRHDDDVDDEINNHERRDRRNRDNEREQRENKGEEYETSERQQTKRYRS